MARTKGSFSLAGAIEPKAAAPLDARSTVKNMEELTMSGSFPYSYIGMETFVTSELKKYVLVGADPTVLANWREQGSGSSESPIIMNYATYQALPTETKNDGKVRYIPDYPSSGGGGGVPSGGTTGQILTKLSDDDGDADWEDAPSGAVEIAYEDYQQLTPEQKNSDTPYFIPDASAVGGMMVVGNRFDKANIYTTTERLIGSYLGKPLYQRTFEFNNASFAHGFYEIADATGCEYVNSWGNDGSEGIPQGYSNYGLFGAIYNSKFCIYSNAALTNQSGRMTFQYTKTSDGTIAIGTPDDYSTDEVIVGTWIDGRPIYQKTLSITLPNNQSTNVTISSNIDKVHFMSGTFFTSGNECLSFPSISGNYIARIYSQGDKLYIANNHSNWSGCNGYVTLQYTKTTD